MGAIFQDGFERAGSVFTPPWTDSTASGTVISEATDFPKFGSYAMKITGIGTAGDIGKCGFNLLTPLTDMYVRCYVALNSVPNAGPFGLGSAIPNLAGASGISKPIFTPGSGWGLRFWGGANYYEAVASAIIPNRYYCVEHYIHYDAAAGIIKLWIDGTLKVNQGALDTTLGGVLQRVEAGERVLDAGQATDRTMWVDGFVVSDQYIGPAPPAPFLTLTFFR